MAASRKKRGISRDVTTRSGDPFWEGGRKWERNSGNTSGREAINRSLPRRSLHPVEYGRSGVLRHSAWRITESPTESIDFSTLSGASKLPWFTPIIFSPVLIKPLFAFNFLSREKRKFSRSNSFANFPKFSSREETNECLLRHLWFMQRWRKGRYAMTITWLKNFNQSDSNINVY